MDSSIAWLLEPLPVSRRMSYQGIVESEVLTNFLQAPLCVWLRNNQVVATSIAVVIGTVVFTSTVLDILYIGTVLFIPEDFRKILWEALVTLIPEAFLFWLESKVVMARRNDTHAGKSSAKTKSDAMFNIMQIGPSGERTQRTRNFIQAAFRGKRGNHASLRDPLGLRGLNNPKVMCYRNSTLQGLGSLDALSTYLDRVSEKATRMGVRGNELKTLNVLHNLIDFVRQPAGNCFNEDVDPVLNFFIESEQQDAQEYLACLMDKVEKEMIKAGIMADKPSLLTALADSHSQNIPSTPGTLSRRSSSATLASIPPSDIRDFRLPLETIAAERKSCTVCGYADSMRLVPTTCITLNMPPSQSPQGQPEYALDELLDILCSSERLEGVNCSACTLRKMESELLQKVESSSSGSDSAGDAELKARLSEVQRAIGASDFSDETLDKLNIQSSEYVRTNKVKQSGFATAPDALAIQINRSSFDYRRSNKDSRPVTFPERLDFSPWYLGSELENPSHSIDVAGLQGSADKRVVQELKHKPKKATYTLRCAVMHTGGINSGHYFAYRQCRINAMRSMKAKPIFNDNNKRRRGSTVGDYDSESSDDSEGSGGSGSSGRKEDSPPTTCSSASLTSATPTAKKLKMADKAVPVAETVDEKTADEVREKKWWLLDDGATSASCPRAVFEQCSQVYMIYYDRVYDEEAAAATPETPSDGQDVQDGQDGQAFQAAAISQTEMIVQNCQAAGAAPVAPALNTPEAAQTVQTDAESTTSESPELSSHEGMASVQATVENREAGEASTASKPSSAPSEN